MKAIWLPGNETWKVALKFDHTPQFAPTGISRKMICQSLIIHSRKKTSKPLKFCAYATKEAADIAQETTNWHTFDPEDYEDEIMPLFKENEKLNDGFGRGKSIIFSRKLYRHVEMIDALLGENKVVEKLQ